MSRRRPSPRSWRWARHVTFALGIALGALLLAEPVAAHAGGLSGSLQSVPVPSWLVVMTGGGVIGASFLFAALVTDHALIRSINGRAFMLPTIREVGRLVRPAAGIAGVLGLVLILLSGFVGPPGPARNLAVLFVWAGWWAGYTMSVYLVGNSWPAVNPWRTLAQVLPAVGRRSLPTRVATWAGPIGLIALVWLEVVSPVAENPRLLATIVVTYTIVTLAGAIVFGRETWFGTVDPISRVFRVYGHMAPIRRTNDGLEVAFPGGALAGHRVGGDVTIPFVIALLWVTTFDGLVATPGWATAAGVVVGLGVPAHGLYLVAAIGGYGLFLVAYRQAAAYARHTGDTYVSAETIEQWFIPSLIPIAAGYHLAHFLGYFISLSPALAAALANPIAGAPDPQAVVLPGWFGGLELAFVLLGHILAIWIAHARAFELFPGRLQPIRSQYPLIAVMIAYTVTSLWIVSQPFGAPPYV